MILGRFCDDFRWFWDDFRMILGWSWDDFRMILAYCWHHFDIILKLFPKSMFFKFDHVYYIELLTLNFIVILLFMISMSFCSLLLFLICELLFCIYLYF